MNSNATKILIAIVLGLALLLSTYGIYRYFSSTPTTETTPIGDTSAFPTSGNITTQGGSDGTNTQAGQATSNPGGSNANTTSGGLAPASGRQTDISTIKIVVEKPSVGGIFIEKTEQSNTSTSTVKKLYVRYMERESGHIYDLAYNENLPKKVSNTTITKVYESFFNNTAKSVVIRNINSVGGVQNIYAAIEDPTATTSPEVGAEATVGKLNQSLLPSGILGVVVSPSKTKIFYLTGVGDGVIGTTEDFGTKQGVNKKQVFNSALSEWLIQWPQEDTLFFNTRPSANVPGFLYSQSLTKTGLNKILGGLNGLTSNVSPDAKRLIYSESTSGKMKTYLYDLTTRVSSPLYVTTLPEKCVWGGVAQDFLYCAVPATIPGGDYPDVWYQGIVSFSDELWQVDTKTGNTELLIDKATFDKAGKGIDAENLILSPKEDYLLMTNKKDSSLWQIRLK
ncbi:MAG: hypothetical protein Q7S19_02075 [bacterium]|nr:hypothetical protein [bacterium]